MNLFNQKLGLSYVVEAVEKLQKIVDVLQQLERRIYQTEIYIRDANTYPFDWTKLMKNKLKLRLKAKIKLERFFQSELAKIIDLDMLPDDILFPILDNIDNRLEEYYADEIKDAYNTGFGEGESKQKYGRI